MHWAKKTKKTKKNTHTHTHTKTTTLGAKKGLRRSTVIKEKNLGFQDLLIQNALLCYTLIPCVTCMCEHTCLCYTAGLMYWHHRSQSRFSTWSRLTCMITDRHSMSEKDTIPPKMTVVFVLLLHSFPIPKFKEFARPHEETEGVF